ncbi:MAG: hypothetical protein GY804_06540 [Alphaproteobacteria bacterium]|nr:hypothetical protein [Alphaproteobacteria bacterium]
MKRLNIELFFLFLSVIVLAWSASLAAFVYFSNTDSNEEIKNSLLEWVTPMINPYDTPYIRSIIGEPNTDKTEN